MKVYFLGTGTSQGIPVIGSTHFVCLSEDTKDKRLRVSVWIHEEDFSVVIDCGPDFRQQMLTSKCSNIDALLFTHEHADHTAGLDDIRPFYFKQGDIPVYGHQRVLQNLAKRFDYIFEKENKYPGAPSVVPFEVVNNQNLQNLARRFDYIFEKENKYPGAPSVIPFEVVNNQNLQIKNQEIIPINAMHGNLQVFGYRIKDFVYLTDVKTIENSELEKLKNVEVLVINALRFEPHNTHFNIEEAINFINLVQPKKAYLTHISHILGLHEEVQKQLPANVFLAYDNLEIEIK